MVVLKFQFPNFEAFTGLDFSLLSKQTGHRATCLRASMFN